MNPNTGGSLTDLERQALDAGLARIYRGRVVPIIRGGEGDGDGGGEGGEGGAGEGDGGTPRTFSQADVDRIVRDRIARVKTEPPADYEDLKAKAAKLAEIEEQNATELERAQKAAADAQAALEQVQADAKETRLTAALLAEAAKSDRKIVDPETVVALIDRSQIDLDDDGTPTNVAQAMDALLEAKPFLVAQEVTRGGADQGARGGGGLKQVTEAELKTMNHREIEKARKEGRLDSLLGVRS